MRGSAAGLSMAFLVACAGGAAVETEISFELVTTAFEAPPPLQPVPFDVVSADMDLDGDPDILVNWHNLAPLELFENTGDGFTLLNPEGGDRAGLFENPGIPSLYAPTEEMLERIGAAARAGLFVWHDPNRRERWNFYVVPDGDVAGIELRGNGTLSVEADERFVRRAGEFDAELDFDVAARFQAGLAFVAAQLKVRASLPILVGPDLLPAGGNEISLWKDDPHGIAWVDVRGTPQPDIYVSRGGLMGNLLPPHDPKLDRFFEYSGGDPLYSDVRATIPADYGRGRRVEWIDIDADMANELYIGNTDTANSLLVAGPRGDYRDIADQVGLDIQNGDTFSWLDVDGDGLDDLVFVDADGFRFAHNLGGLRFDLRPGEDIGLVFPAGSEPDQDRLFATLSLNVLDYNSDGDLDLWLLGHGESRRHALYRGTDGGFTDVTVEVGLDQAFGATGLIPMDVDNDGYLDAITLGLDPLLLHNDGGQRFEMSRFGGDEWGLKVYTRGVAVDVDLDRRLDVVMMGDRRLIARNTTSGAGSALRVVPRASGGDPVGTLVRAFYANGMVQAQRYGSASTSQYSQGLVPLHFGIPAGTFIERLVVRWPDGTEETRALTADEDFVELRR